jgi:hypothetical protein
VNPAAYTPEPTLAQPLTGLMHDAQKLLRQEVALAKHEVRVELRWRHVRQRPLQGPPTVWEAQLS